MNNTILLLVGESGSGKTAVAKVLNEQYGLKTLPSYTTRPKRYENEKGHTFVSEKEFRNIKIKDIAAYSSIGDYEYCATSQQIDDNDVYIIDLEGIRTFRNNYKGSKKVKIVYLKVSQDLRKQRMKKRGDTEKNINFRLRNDAVAFNGIKELADIIIENNGCITETVKKIWRYYVYEK